MKERFEGADGRRNLLAALKDQRVVEHQQAVADFLAEKGAIQEYHDGDTVIEQGGSDTWSYFILTGEAKIFVNNREVGIRGPRELVGEMVVLEPAAPRSATVKSQGDLVVLRVAGSDLEDVANQFASVWRAIGRVMTERLRDRARYHRPQNERPIIFLGCAVEGLDIAREIEEQFKHDKVVVRPWTAGVFGAGGVPVDELLKQVSEADFALFVFTPDDKVHGRDKDQDAPRDNVVFEMGLFMDRLSRIRCFMLREHKLDLKIPTDLLGITPITYVKDTKKTLTEQLGPPCNELRKLIRGLGAL